MFKGVTYLTYILSLSFAANLADESVGHCVIRGECGKDPTVSKRYEGRRRPPVLPCVDNEPSTVGDPDIMSLLMEVCPHFVPEIGDRICCTKKQVKKLKKDFGMILSIASNCPTCIYNIKKVFCDFTCHPRQSTFLNVTRSVWGPNSQGKEVQMAKELTYYSNIDFAKGVYNSCKDVLFPSQGIQVITFLCGTSSVFCNPKALFRYMGSVSNGQSPFPINFVFSDEDVPEAESMTFHNPKTLPCNNSPSNTSNKCSCTNCELSCPTLDFSHYKENRPFKLFGIDGLSVVMTGIFLSFTVGFLFFLGGVPYIKDKLSHSFGTSF